MSCRTIPKQTDAPIAGDMVDLRAPLGNSPAALAELFTNDIAPLQGAPPAPSSGAAAAGNVSQQPGSKELRRMSTDSGALSLGSPRAQQQGRRKRANTPQLRSFRTFMRDREAVHRSQSSARLKVRYSRLASPPRLACAPCCIAQASAALVGITDILFVSSSSMDYELLHISQMALRSGSNSRACGATAWATIRPARTIVSVLLCS